MQGIFAGLTGAAKVSGAGSSEPSSQTVRSSKAPVRFILGRASTGGVLAWIQEQPGDQTSGEWLHIVYVLSEGAIAGVDQIYVDERPLSELGENATSEVIIDPAQVNAFLLANCPDWRQEQIGRGLSFVRLSFKYDAEKFPSGIPDVRFVVRGRRDIYDPRNGSSGYSANTALLILWYLRNRCGIPDDEIIFQSFASAANISDEAVGGPDGTVTPRYFAGAVIGADEKRNTVLDNLLSACAGTLIRVGGRWSLQVGAYYGPADFTINEDMVIGTVEGTTEVSNSDAINTMRGTFVDPAQAWAETDYPEVAIQDWITADGGELAESQSFAYVTDAYLAQRLANISLRRRRSGGSVSMPLNFNGYNCRPGRAVKVDLPSLNILGEFMVTEWTMGAADACKVTLKPYEQAIFDDAVGQPYDPLGFINLPVGGLAAVTGLAWTPSSVAEIIQGVLSWVSPAQTVLSYTVTIRKGTEVVQSLKVGGEAVSCNINGLASGTYAMSVVAFGPGTRSGEASINVNVGGPPVPESCDYFASVDSITLVPVNRQNSLNGGTYEYFHATNPQTPIADAVYLGQGLTFTHTGLAFAKQYFYYVRSANAYGKSDFLYVAAATSDDPTQMLEVIKGEILESHLGQQLTEKIDLIDGNGPGSVNERVGSAKTELAQQISEVNNALATAKGNLEQQITATNQNVADAKSALEQQIAVVDGEVDAAKADLQQKIDSVSVLAGSLPYNKDKTYTTNQGVLGADGKLYQALKAVPKNTPPPNATYWTDVGQAIVTAAGTASRVSKVETDVFTLDGKSTAQASQIGGLQSGLTATNQNVTAAQQAADAANTLAGGKGKVIVQAAAPAVADRLAQNLWIDTTGNANTPKRWNGTTWVAVTDKAASDAAAAAQSALSQVALKADATVVNSVATRVSEAEGKLSSQATRMDGMQTSIDGKASSQSLQQVSNRVTDTEQKDAVQDQQLTSQSQALISLTDSVSKKAEAATVQALSNDVKTQGQNQTAQGQALTRIDTKLLAGQDNSPTKVYQSVFSDLSADQWVSTNSGAGAVASFGTSAGITRGAALILNGGTGNATWWGASTRKIRFDPSRLYKLTARVQQVSSGAGAPLTYLGLDCFAEDGATRVTTAGGTGIGSAHYVLMNSRQLSVGEWVTVEAYVKGYSAAGEDGGSGAGTFTDPKRLKTGVAWLSPLVIAGYNGMGGRLVVDLFDIEDATEQAQIDAGAMATTALTGRVEKTEQGLSSVSSQTTQLGNSLTTTNQNLEKAQQAAQAASDLAGTKGKVLVQAAEPAVADRLVQNLWIDTTGNANTPKRWTGNAWAAVTDKVATEAAAAAAAALSEVAKKADASAVQSLNSKVDQQGRDLTATSNNVVSLGSTIGRALDNSPTKVYQSVFSDMSMDQWVSTNSGVGSTISYGTPAGITRGAALVVSGGAANKTWWGASTRKLRFDPSRLYKLTVRVQQVLMGAGSPGTYAGVDCFAEDGITRIATTGANSVGSSHYVVLTNRKIPQGEWLTAETYVKGHTTGSEGGGAGSGTLADPKRLKEGTAWFSPMLIAGYDSMGGQAIFDFFDIEDVTEQAQVDANAAATSALTTKVSQNEQGLSSASKQLTDLNNSVGSVAAQQAATSQAVDSLSSAVSQQAGNLSGVSTRTTTLENSLTTTNQNVATAQQAADAANTLAGGKGKVIIQATAPAVADRLAQNLWIDTASNANTPKRWSGTAWVAVTDKAATDAAAAAANALSVAQTKADSSVVQGINSRVTDAEGKLTSQGQAITAMDNSLTVTNQNVTTAQQAAQAAADSAGAKGKVLYQSAAPAVADRLAQNLWIDTTNNANTPKRWSGSAWVAVTDKAAIDAAAAAQSALTQVATKAEASALQTLTNRVAAAEGVNTSQSASLIDLSNNVGAIQSGLGASGLDPAPGAYWQFDAGAEGWVSINANIASSGGSLRLTPTSNDPQLLSSSGALSLSIPGAQYTKVRVGLTRRGGAATAWTGSLYYATVNHGISSNYRATAPNPNIAVGQSAVVEWDMTNLVAGGTNWIESQIGRLRFNFANDLDSVWDVDWIAVGRVGPSASSRVVESLTSTVTQQGDKLTAEAQRIDGLYTSVGNAQAAIQNEITARTNADSALSQQLQTTQATLGETTASVQRVSTTLNQLNGVANASEVVKVQITANGIRHVAGFGLSIDNSKGAVQSTFAILAGRFAILNPSGDAISSPFAVYGNQTFISDAYIRDASITNAKIANAAITSAKIGDAEVDTLRIRGNAVTIPVGAFAGSSTVSVTVTLDGNYPVFLLGSLTQTYQSDISMTRNGVLLWTERPQNSTLASRGVMDYPGPGTHTYTLSSNHGGNTNGASILAVVCKR
ncbi:phage tail tip fiber protein [Pseudomonas putida]